MDPVSAAPAHPAGAQGETQSELRGLVQAQRRAEEAVQSLAQQAGRLGDTVASSIEDLARDLPPDRPAHRCGISVSSLARAFFRVDGHEIELDVYGVGQRDGGRVAVIGGATSRIYGRDVEAPSERTRQLAAQLPGTPLPVLFGFAVHPSAERASRPGAIVIASGG